MRSSTCRLLCALLLLTLPLPGCISITRVSELERLEGEMRAAENRRRVALQRLEERVRQLEAQPRSAAGARAGAPAVPAPGRRAGVFGGTYRQAIATDPPKLDPAHLQDTTSHRVGSQMLEGLVEFDDELNVVPLIAKSWVVGGDNRSYTFTLREGVKFHHGRAVTAEDFVYSFGRILDPKTVSTRTWLFDRILGYPLFQAYRRAGELARKQGAGEKLPEKERLEVAGLLAGADRIQLEAIGHPDPAGAAALAARLAAYLRRPTGGHDLVALQADTAALSSWDFLRRGLEARDPHTLVVRLDRPFAPFLNVLAMVNAAVVPREKVEELGDQFAFHPVGTGPFQFVRWEHDVVVELEAFEDYFQGRPYLDRLSFRIIPDDLTRLIEFEAGNLESVNRIPDEKYEAIKADPSFPGVLDEKPILHVFYIAMNVEKPPFDNVLVRRAFNHAVDPRPIIEKIRKGRGQVAVGPLPPGLNAYEPGLEGYPYDPAKARALLKQAGFEDPADLGTVDFWFNSSNPQDVNSKIASVFQQYLGDIGVTLRLNPVEWGTYLDMVDRGDPAILRLAWVGDYPDADNFLYVLFHSSVIGQGNASRYAVPEVDAWLEQARESHDQKARLELYRKAQRRIVADAPWIPLFHQLDPFLHKAWVKGAVLNGRGSDAIRYKRVWIDPDLQAQGAAGAGGR